MTFSRNKLRLIAWTVGLVGIGAAPSVLAAPAVSAQAPSAPSPPVFSADFEGDFVPVPTAPQSPGSPSVVRGNIPAGWTEDSSYGGSDVSVRYSKITDAAVGRGALRIEVDRVTSGGMGIRLDRLKVPAGTFLKVRLTARCVAGGAAGLLLRSAPPYKSYWSQSISPGAEWKTFEFIIPPLKAADDSAQFLVTAQRPVTMDIDDLSVVPIREDEVGAGFKGEGNLLPLSSFPVGLAKPWIAPYSTASGAVYRPDPATPGLSGLPSLRFDPGILFYDAAGKVYYDAFITAPFFGKPNAVHTFSVYLKGTKTGQVVRLRLSPSVNNPGPEFAKVFPITTDWQRYEFSVKLPFTTDGYYSVQVRSAGAAEVNAPFWVDQAQVEVGDKATPFRRPAAVEVALTPTANFGLHFEGEPLKLEATVYGDITPGTTLVGTFYDTNGRAFPVKPQSLKPGEKQQRVAFTLPPGREAPFGDYRFVVEARRGGAVVSKPSEATLARVRRPRKPEVFAPDSPFGIHTQKTESNLRLVQDLGFKWLRMEVNWSQIERPDGTWDWTQTDEEVRLVRDHKLSLLGILTGGPAKYGVNPEENKGWNYWSGMVRPEHLGTLEEATKRIASRYKGQITEWETQNESDLPNFSFGGIVNGVRVGKTGRQMADWQKATYTALKSVDPNNRVWWNLAWARPPESVAFVKAATEAGIWQWVDGFSYHLYNGNFHAGPGSAIEQRIKLVREVMPADKKQLPVWDSEGGFWPNEVRDLTPLTPPVVNADRNAFFADFPVRYYVQTLANGTPKFFFFNLNNGEYNAGHEILNADGSLSQQALSVSNLAWHLEGKKFAKLVPMPNGVNAYLFSDGKDSVAVLLSSNAGRLSVSKAPAGVAVRDVLGNAVAFPAKIGDEATYWSGAGMGVDTLAGVLGKAVGRP